MGGSTFGKIFKVITFGESHGKGLGVVIEGCPAGLDLSEGDLQKELDRRKPGTASATSPRKEDDKAEILSGLFNGKTTGSPISIIIRNSDARSHNYEEIKDVFRPGHADYTFFEKYGFRDYRGGGRSSGRETASRVAAGAVAKKILNKQGVSVYGYTIRVGDIGISKFDPIEINRNDVRCPDHDSAKKMVELINRLKKEGDSIGGIVEIIVEGTPAGLGEPVFDKLDADIAKGVMSIGSVKGVEIGNGFLCAGMQGSANNDEIYFNNGKIGFKSNNSGGILGGISNGDKIVTRIAVKPTASIKKEQKTVNEEMKEVDISVKGRHDPCICPRIIPVAESMISIVLADHLLRNFSAKL